MIRLSKLQKWILNNCENKPITWNDTLSGFYGIESMIAERDRQVSREEFYKLDSKIKYRREVVPLAFSQLYLAKLVKRKWGGKWMDIDEQIQDFISFCDRKIKGCREALKEDKNNILMKMTLGNYLEKKDNVLNNTKIMKSKDWNKGETGKYAAQGQLCIIGGDMYRYVYPSEIILMKGED